MTRCKRRYVPKVRGCYECSQRRIDCDRSEPSCDKCAIRGIQCSGLGIRYRFSDDRSQRGRTMIACVSAACHTVTTHVSHPDIVQPASLPSVTSVPHMPQDLRERNVHWITFSNTSNSIAHQAPHHDIAEDDINADHETSSTTILRSSDFADVDGMMLAKTGPHDTLRAWKRHLLSYFSSSISPEMVVVDDQYNGWRCLVLNVARLDDLVMDAALSAAAFHFTSKFGSHFYNSDAIYANAIRRLREREDLASQDMFGRQTVLLSLVVLLATVMVNGFSDFLTIFELLESAVEAVGGEEQLMQGELGFFVVRQIRKYRGYAAPFLSQSKGFARLSLSTTASSRTTNGWECFHNSCHIHPELSHPLSMIHRINQLSCDIYVARASIGPGGPPLTHLIEEFKATLDQLQPDHPGEHTLVFATFLAAAESEIPAHREHLRNALLKHHQRNNFGNILLALEHLEKIWKDRDRIASNDDDVSHQSRCDWTYILPTLQLFIV